MAIWDTVEALGWPDRTNDPRENLPRYFIETCNIDRVFHALSIDDNRAHSFTPIFVRPKDDAKVCAELMPQTDYAHRSTENRPPAAAPAPVIEEVWFAGAHADIGGGYGPNALVDGYLSGVSLNWMLNRLNDEGLFARDASVFEDRYGPIHDAKAYTTAYVGLTRHRRDPFRYEYGAIGADARPYVHISVLQRYLRLDDLERVFHGCPTKKDEPRVFCTRELKPVGFLGEAVAADGNQRVKNAPKPIGIPCLYPSVRGYALEPRQKCIHVVCDPGSKEATSDSYCGLEERAEIRELLVRKPMPGQAPPAR